MTFNSDTHDQSRHHVYEVSELNQKLKQLLEKEFSFLWISGEISNFKVPTSGHCYFSLKDPYSQINAVMFRAQARSLKFRPEDGMSIVGLGRVSVYEPRGAYQIILEYMEPRGIGALQIAFEKLKQKLADEGLFDAQHKRPMPILPKKISIVTSPTGAAVRDFIKVAQRRFPHLPLEVVPVTVQGDRSPGEIIRAIHLLNRIGTTDIIVLARGGGSIEDLSAFNDEQLARTIFASDIPIVSAIGHETDFTITDFVADLRAPTPSAAAEIVVPSKNEFKDQLFKINQKLYTLISLALKLYTNKLNGISDRIIHPQRRLQDMRIRLDDYSIRLVALIKEWISRNKERAGFHHIRLMHASPAKTVATQKDHAFVLEHTLITRMNHIIRERQAVAAGHESMLDALNPMAILQRGYSITRTLPERTVVRNPEKVNIGQSLEILLESGELTVTVADKRSET